MKVRKLRFTIRRNDDRPYQVAVIALKNGSQVQVCESPSGRSVQIHVDETQVWANYQKQEA